MQDECYTCRHNFESYHCTTCAIFDGEIEDCESFCGYCNHHKGTDPCGNCIFGDM